MTRFNLSLVPFVLACTALVGACAPRDDGSRAICVTIAPLEMIVAPIAEGRAEVLMLLPPGASPHTHDLTPSGARTAARAMALISVDASLDAWATRVGARESLEVVSLLSNDLLRTYDGDVPDPHFWLDPIAVRGIVPAVAAYLSEIDPEGAQVYTHNADALQQTLDALHEELKSTLAPVRGAPVVQHHPSLNYFLARYGLRSVGAIEASPGQEPTPRDLQRLVDTMRAEDVRVVVTEPQLPRAPVNALAEATGVRVVELDPVGGVPRRATYEELLRYNARALAEALQ